MDTNNQIISVKRLAESFYADDICRNRTNTFSSTLEYSNEPVQTRLVLTINSSKIDLINI